MGQCRAPSSSEDAHVDDSSPEAGVVVRRWCAAFNSLDLDAALRLAHPTLSFRPLRIHGSSTWHGRDGLRELWVQMTDLGLGHRVDVESVHATSDGRILALGAVEPGGLPFAGIYRVEEGMVREAMHYFSREGLLEQLGIAGMAERRSGAGDRPSGA